MKDKARIKSILRDNLHMVLSTADKDGRPWITPVAYTFDKHYSLYWMSSKDARHSVNARARKEVAIVIYSIVPVTDALYIEAEAQELVNETEITSAIEVILTRPQSNKWRVTSPSDVSGEASWRIYKAMSKSMYVREQSTIGTQSVTVRRKVL